MTINTSFHKQRQLKPNDVYKPIRNVLKPGLKALGFSRVKSAPPAYAKTGGFGCICLWFKLSSGGWDYALGGKFTGVIQSAAVPHPGIESMAGEFASARLWRLLDEPARQQAVQIHNAIIGKFSAPPEHWMYTMKQEVVDSMLADLKPLTTTPSVDSGFWFRYLDAEDVDRWAKFFGQSLSQMVETFESSLA